MERKPEFTLEDVKFRTVTYSDSMKGDLTANSGCARMGHRNQEELT